MRGGRGAVRGAGGTGGRAEAARRPQSTADRAPHVPLHRAAAPRLGTARARQCIPRYVRRDALIIPKNTVTTASLIPYICSPNVTVATEECEDVHIGRVGRYEILVQIVRFLLRVRCRVARPVRSHNSTCFRKQLNSSVYC